jgi:hypothetical protein
MHPCSGSGGRRRAVAGSHGGDTDSGHLGAREAARWLRDAKESAESDGGGPPAAQGTSGAATGSGGEVLPLWLSKGREGGESGWREGEWMGNGACSSRSSGEGSGSEQTCAGGVRPRGAWLLPRSARARRQGVFANQEREGGGPAQRERRGRVRARVSEAGWAKARGVGAGRRRPGWLC